MVDKGAKPGQVTGAAAKKAEAAGADSAQRRSRVLQTDVPAYSLDDALRVARAIADNYALQPSTPFDVAAAMKLQPKSSYFRMLTGAAIAYGLTAGGAKSDKIAITPLARRIVASVEEGDDVNARREALLHPKVIREFLTKYDNNKLPRDDIAVNVLVTMGVPRDTAEETLKFIVESAESVGLFRNIKDQRYVSIRGVPTSPAPLVAPLEDDEDEAEVPAPAGRVAASGSLAPEAPRRENRRVFITHGRNKAFIDPLKDLLAFGELEPIVSVERESVSQPVPDKVMTDMRSCSAAIIHVEEEEKLMTSSGDVKVVLNPNVLIEIGAAMALYGRRFILLVKTGVELPSNLQGLYEVRYEGDKLDGEATIRLLKAIKDIKNHALPDVVS